MVICLLAKSSDRIFTRHSRQRESLVNTTDLRIQLRTDWAGLAGAGAYFVSLPGEAPGEYQSDVPLDVGSCFKVVVAVECCRQVERDMLAWDERLWLDADVRIQDSTELGELPDGYELTVRAAAEAMIRSSDNTAT